MTIRRIGHCIFLHRLIVLCAALLVPHWRRTEWLAEWRSELWYVSQRCHGTGRSLWWNWPALSFCLGAFRDAVWLRRHDDSSNPRPWLQSPVRCLVFLAAAAAATGVLFFRSPGPIDAILRANQKPRELMLAHLLVITIAFLVLPATTSLALGEYPATPGSPARVRRFRRWIFLGLKLVLILPIVFCGAYALSPLVSAKGLQPHAMLAGYVLAFRWALVDQRRRCPVCLRLLSSPATIGQPAHTFLEWYGTELYCIKGHGLLHVPEISTTYSTERWLDLDASWRSLFS